MSESTDIVDYIRELRMVLADSIDVLLNLQSEEDEEEDLVPITCAADLIDMSYDLARSSRLKAAESEFLKRQT
ncbi:MAG TPA: hypothetical protein VNK44_01755 [Candidatus Nitrosotenuis sp.]|nr:hypothetical protein [Candidatus Nitrosotenuis sp.]